MSSTVDWQGEVASFTDGVGTDRAIYGVTCKAYHHSPVNVPLWDGSLGHTYPSCSFVGLNDGNAEVYPTGFPGITDDRPGAALLARPAA